MNRCEVTELIVETKRRKGLTYAEIADKLGTDRVWTTAALLGQHPFDADGARGVAELLDLPEEAGAVLAEVPMRGSLDQVPPPTRPSTAYTRCFRSTGPPSRR